MPALSYTESDFVAFTKIRSAAVNSRFSDIKTLLNDTKLDDDNLQDAGITRADKLKAGTANYMLVNDATGKMSEQQPGALGTILVGKGTSTLPAFLSPGSQGQILQSNGSNDPSWIESPFKTPSHYIKSGEIDANEQPAFIRPDGGGADDYTIRAATTPLVVVIEDTEYSFSSDINVTGLDAPATSNNTAALNYPNAADEDFTKLIGEDKLAMNYDGGGSNFLPAGGEGVLHAFKINDGASDEYFIGRFKLDATATTGDLYDCKRGYFFDSSGAIIPRLGVTDNDTLTIQKLYWVFISSTGTARTTDLEPIYSHSEPSAPSTDQMWFDTANSKWKHYNGSSFDEVLETLIGQVIVDENDEVVGSRACDIFAQTSELNTVVLKDNSATEIQGNTGSRISVMGNTYEFKQGRPVWDITNTDIRVGTEDASTRYYEYVAQGGELKMEATAPYNRPDLKGYYHPSKPWRCVGSSFNDSSSDLSGPITINKPVWARKHLTANISVDTTDISDLRIDNLEPGKLYELKMYVRIQSADQSGEMNANHDGTVLLELKCKTPAAGNDDVFGIGGSAYFQATATSLTFNFDENTTATLVGNSTFVGFATHVYIREAPELEQLTDAIF